MPPDLSLAELAALADVPVRTIRYYIAQGLLPSPGREGQSTRYPVSVLHRLRAIRRLQRGHLPLAEIRKRLGALSDEDVEAFIEEASEPPAGSALDYVRSVLAASAAPSTDRTGGVTPAPAALLRSAVPRPATAPAAIALEPPTTQPSTPAPAPPAPERSQWERIVLEPDVELHVRRPLSRIANRRVERLIALARELLEEDQP